MLCWHDGYPLLNEVNLLRTCMQVCIFHFNTTIDFFKAYYEYFLGTNFGTIISLPLSGWLCSLEFDGGWPLCFYLFGGIGIIWFIFWMFLVYDTPSSHPRIDRQEQAFILASIGPQASILQIRLKRDVVP